ncbi:hypothetical protein LIER_11815 [Lithospermum erythrorhizon]|uniref:Uncharacterized protein n=1 Tax=Lithospermum erythrorhizon TaxID=34254 RepID=A0AAV3PRR7_LITER
MPLTFQVIMASSSPSGKHSPSPSYSTFSAPTPRRTPSLERVAQLRDMENEIFEQLEVDLEDDPEYSVMRAALGLFFRWVDLMDTLDEEAQLRRSPYLILLEDARSEVVSQSLHNRELLSHADPHLVDSMASCRLLERNQTTLSELAVIAHRVEFYAGSIRALQARHELLDREVVIVDQAFRSTAVVGAHYSDIEGQLEARLGALEHLLPF